MKYKVGDKVRIRKDLEYGRLYDGGCLFVGPNLVGEIVRITEVNKRAKCYRINLGRYFWTDEMLEDADTEVR